MSVLNIKAYKYVYVRLLCDGRNLYLQTKTALLQKATVSGLEVCTKAENTVLFGQ
jgi:hypothetical protein